MISERRFTQALAATVAATSMVGCLSKQAAPPPAAPPRTTSGRVPGRTRRSARSNRSRPVSSTSDMRSSDRPPARRWCSSTAGLTTRTATFPVEGNGPERAAMRGGPRHHRPDGRPRNRQSDPWGFDWGVRTVNIIAALWPERTKALVAVSGYGINDLKANLQPLAPAAEYGWWCQYYFATQYEHWIFAGIGHDVRKRHNRPSRRPSSTSTTSEAALPSLACATLRKRGADRPRVAKGFSGRVAVQVMATPRS
jgi:hypothetical protein